MKKKELMVIKPPEYKPQYGGRTLVEKVTAYKLMGEIYFDVREVAAAEMTMAYRVSDGEIIKDRESALKRQVQLDLNDRIELFINSEFNSVKIESQLLQYYDHIFRNIPL